MMKSCLTFAENHVNQMYTAVVVHRPMSTDLLNEGVFDQINISIT